MDKYKIPPKNAEIQPVDTPVHDWFELTYAQYLTIPRSIMEAMPVEWQERMVACLRELDATFNWRPEEGRYWVELRNGNQRYAHDPLREYRRPNHAYIECIRCTPETQQGENENDEHVGVCGSSDHDSPCAG